jgi:hypothetical protein
MEKQTIYSRLLEVQKEVGAIAKDSENPFFKNKYFDINGLIQHVNPILTKHGLLLLQPILEGKQCSIIVEAETGEKVVSELTLPTLTDPQKLGSAITYYRRYTLGSLLGLQAEDDDGNVASKESKKPVKQQVKDFDALLLAISNPDKPEYTKDWAFKVYDLTEI